MPTPHGQPPRPRKFLLRMTVDEDTFVRREAGRQQTSINDVIVRLIADAMQPPAAPPPPPAPAPPSGQPPKGRERRRGSARLTWSDVADPPEAIPGQTSVLDEDQ